MGKEIIDAAIEACRLGIFPVPVEHGGKKPIGTKWQEQRITEADAPRHFSNGNNLGALNGIAPFYLLDLDIDAPEAVSAASFLTMPPTERVFGHASKRSSHYLYQASVEFKKKSFKDPVEGKDSRALIEVLGAGSQSVWPPSTHVSGEPIEWERKGAFGKITISEALRAAGKIAAAALLVRYSIGGHEMYMAVAAMLAKGCYPEPEATEFLEAVIKSRKPDRNDAGTFVRNAYDRVEADGHAWGFTHFAKLLGDEDRAKRIADKITEWLDLRRATANKEPAAVQVRGHEDTSNAERFVAMHRDKVRYWPEKETWLVWDGKRWAEDAAGRSVEFAKQTARAIYAEASVVEDKAERAEVAEWAEQSLNRHRLKSMLELAQSDPQIVTLSHELDADPWVINCRNGTLDLRTGVLRSHDPADLITKICGSAYEPSDYPRWRAALDKVFPGNTDLQDFLQRAAGYSLTGVCVEQKWFYPFGDGANFKGTFLNVMSGLLGEYAYAAANETFLYQKFGRGIENDLAAMKGARLVISSEPSEGRRLDEGLIKKVTGEDPLHVRFLHREFFTYTPQFKLWLMANYRLTVRDDSHAMWRRLLQVPFSYIIPEGERIDNYAETLLKEEREGIFTWAVQGCAKWREKKLSPPHCVMEATREYRDEQDTFKDFLENYCVIGPNESELIVKLHKAFQIWASESKQKPLTLTAFGRELTRRRFDKIHRTGHRGGTLRAGIGLQTAVIERIAREEERGKLEDELLKLEVDEKKASIHAGHSS